MRVLEKHVEQTVREFMELDGWRVLKTDPVSRREWGKGFGEIGMPDLLFIRYGLPITRRGFSGHPPEIQSAAQVIWVEVKRPGGKPRADQVAWIEGERSRGALVLVVDDIDVFKTWYLCSGLNRKVVNRAAP